MRFVIRTPVAGSPAEVFAGMDSQLLLRLTPPGMRVRLLQFDDPIRPEGIVHVEVKVLGFFRQEWYNKITELEHGPDGGYFTDVGVRLPAMLRQWRHKHVVTRGVSGGTEIHDDITFHSSNALFTVLLFPMIYLQFWYRKPIYRKYFRKATPV